MTCTGMGAQVLVQNFTSTRKEMMLLYLNNIPDIFVELPNEHIGCAKQVEEFYLLVQTAAKASPSTNL